MSLRLHRSQQEGLCGQPVTDMEVVSHIQHATRFPSLAECWREVMGFELDSLQLNSGSAAYQVTILKLKGEVRRSNIRRSGPHQIMVLPSALARDTFFQSSLPHAHKHSHLTSNSSHLISLWPPSAATGLYWLWHGETLSREPSQAYLDIWPTQLWDNEWMLSFGNVLTQKQETNKGQKERNHSLCSTAP